MAKKQITRTATEADLPELLARPAHAHVAFARDGRVEALPVACERIGDAWRVRGVGLIPAGKAMLLVDDGVYYFELRGLRYPGEVAPPGEDGWQAFIPEKAIGWHYGHMRAVEAT